jgi:UTP--glucose-1-phosphate uridylyltransferase
METNDIILGGDDQRTLETFGFDRIAFQKLAADLAAGKFPADRNRIQGRVEKPKAGDIVEWPAEGTAVAREAETIGRAAIANGEVAVAILNGGMATRFGGMVKCLVKVVDAHTFLDLKLKDIVNSGAPVSVFLMNSFATDDDTRAHLTARDYCGVASERLHIVAQHVSLRLTPEGKLYRDANGHLSLFAPGHGDIFDVLANAPAFRRFKASGGKYVLVSNVDNLAATLTPKIVGLHVLGKKPLTVEVATKEPGDQGGAPARVDGKLQIVEGFRFPASFKQDDVPVFNTNTFLIDAARVRADYPLTWFRADKKVDGAPVVQFERLMGEATAFEDAQYLEVPRAGREGRFLPVKTPDDLKTVRDLVRDRLLRKE